MTEKQYSLSEAAELLGVTTKTLRNWDKQGKLRATRTEGGHRRVSGGEIARLTHQALTPSQTITMEPTQISGTLNFPFLTHYILSSLENMKT